nr:Light-sensor Protein kinase [Polyrhizophydium stewartii]
MGRVMIAINFRCAKPTSLPFSCLPLLNALTWTFSQSIECCIMADQIRSELVLANQMLELLGTEIGQEESFVPYAPELVRKSGVERLARCVSGLLAIISVDAAIVCLGSDLEIVQPGTDEEEIRRIAAFLRSKHFAHMHVSRCCERDFPDAVRIGPDGEKHSIFFNIAGILLVPLSKCGHSFIALLRRQEIQFATSLRINDFTDEFEVTDTKQQSCREWSPREQNMAKLLQVVFWSFVGSLQQREDGLRNEHLKTMLLANISHEVRTPLNAIVNFLEMMLDDPGSDSFQALWKLALDASRSVVHIISELLLVTETGWGAVQMRREPFRIMDCIRSCAGMFPAACKNRGLRFSLVMNESNRDAVVIGDQGKLRQVLTNLLGNAVKYTERGFVELRVESQVLDNSTLEVTLSVRDSGMGIPESKLGAIFDAFERITDVGDKRSEIEGAGLGLSICAKLASLMNGSLTVESTENVGSTFTFVDNVANQRVVVLRLARDGHTTHVFDNGRALIDFVTSPEHPRVDLALVDLDMPGMLGVEVVHLIREAEANTGMPRIPVVAITASVSLADRDECIRAGMDGFLGKPLDFGVLRRMLNDIADGSWLRRADDSLFGSIQF